MRSINKATLLGNCGGDPEVRSTGTGARVASFSVATSRQWKGKDGQQNEATQWHRVVAWEKLAEIVEQWLKKGDRVYVEGEIEYRQYEKDGVTKYATEIRAREIVLLGNKGDGTSERQAPRAQKPPSDYDSYRAPAFEDAADDPFAF